MQQNSAEIYSKLSRYPENVLQQSSSNPTQFIRVTTNPKFAITPESMDMNLGSDLSGSSTREQRQQHVQSPLVDVKSYDERHSTSSMRIQADNKRESNVSFHTSHPTNTPINQHASSIKTDIIAAQHITCFPEFMTPKKTSSQPWNFETSVNNDSDCTQQLNRRYSSRNNNSQCANLPETSLYFEQEMQKYISGSDVCGEDTARLNLNHLNDLYAKRIEYIDENAWGDKDLKIFTYKEWIKILTGVNESFIKNMSDLEKEVSGRLELMQGRVNSNCRYSQGQELMKYRKDFATLLQYVRNSPYFKKRDLLDLSFETISTDQLLDMGDFDNITIEDVGGDENKKCNDADVVQKNKLYANMKALAHEVAEKHDEVRELKRQVICLEDEIQKAQKKIQLKDDVIKELRNDLKAANSKISGNPSPEPSLAMPPINFDNETSSRIANTDITPTSQIDNCSQFDSLSHTEDEEQQKIKLLDEEINEFFAMNEDLNKQKIEYHHLRIKDIMLKLESEKADAYRKLNFIRRQLIDLESDSTESNIDCDSGFHSKSENNQDAKILDAIRKRLRALNDMNCELKKRTQKLELEMKELVNNFQTDKSFAERNSNILKQLADLLCDMKGKQFSYTEIYSSDSNEINPFCEAIIELQRDFQEKENLLIKALGMKNKQNEELSHLLMENEKNFKDERTIRMKLKNCEDIENNTSPATKLLTPAQPLPVVTSSVCTVSSQTPSTLSTSLTGQQLESKTSSSLIGLVD